MDIRTKLAITLVGVSLLSMWVLGFFAYQGSAALLQEFSVRQLDALAESKARDARKVVSGWRDRVQLISSRTQLRVDVDAYNAAPTASATNVSRIQRIVADAQRSTPSVLGIALYAEKGDRLASAGIDVGWTTPPTSQANSTPTYTGYRLVDGRLQIAFTTDLQLEGRRIGSIQVCLDGQDLSSVTTDYTGLGESGDTILATSTDDTLAVLRPLRHSASADLQPSAAVRDSTLGIEKVYTGDLTNHRGQAVWSATRYIGELGWGLTVEIDEAEELQHIVDYRSSMIELSLAVSAFAILAGTLLGMLLGRPISELAALVDRVLEGQTNLRADVTGEDEVGRLARALNSFLDARAPPPK